VKKLEYIASGGESGFMSPLLIGKRILSVMKDGVGMSKIVTSAPIDKQAQYINSTGGINFFSSLAPLEDVIVLYDDEADVCFPVAVQSGFTLPDAVCGQAYNASFFVSGTPTFNIASIVKTNCSWLSVTLTDTMVTFSGTPLITDAGTATVSFTLSNACGSAPFSQNFNVNTVPAQFVATTFISGDRLTEVEIANLSGTSGVVVTVTLDTLTNSNGGNLKVNGVIATVGNTYNVTLGVSGGTLNVEIDGITSRGSAILGHFTITAVSAGEIGILKTYQISKVF